MGSGGLDLSPYDVGALLLVLAAGIGLVNDRWFHAPRNIALLIGSMAAATLVLLVDGIRLDGPMADYWSARMHKANLSGVLLDGVLALLLFASTMHVNPRELRDRDWSVLMLATLGVVVASAIFGGGLYFLTWLAGAPIPLVWCIVVGTILAPTDAVVVENLLRRVRMPAELRGMITGESLFNDGAAVVLFLAALALAAGDGSQVGHGRLTLKIAEEVLGGGLLGWSAGFAAVALSRGLKDRTLELTISLALALGTYRIAAGIGVSGPIAVVAAGLAWRHAPRRLRGRDPQQEQVAASWGVIDDLLNTWLFLLMGFQVLTVRPGSLGYVLLPLVFLLAVLARALSVGIPVALSRMPAADKGRGIAVLSWTGLRGGISIALALTLPDNAYHERLLTICYAVVIMTIVIQGLTVPRLLRVLYPPPGRKEAPDDTG
jgi:CPA1 family monovalent cation:H+ antiporter